MSGIVYAEYSPSVVFPWVGEYCSTIVTRDIIQSGSLAEWIRGSTLIKEFMGGGRNYKKYVV